MPSPREFPPDEQIGQWIREHGTTGVKTYTLSHPANKGCVAVYREMSMGERHILARMSEVDEEHPGAYDYQRMLVSSCLLHPNVSDYPKSPLAVAELFGRIRQHGHGPLDENEEMITRNEDLGAIPEHVVEDLKNARSSAFSSFHETEFGSVYKDLVIQLATGPQGQIDAQAFDYLWSLSPGKIRDLAALIEQAHADIRREGIKWLQQTTEMEGDEKQKRAEMIEENFASPLESIDEVVGDAATPDDDEDPEPDDEPQSNRTVEPDDSGLPPNRPPSEKEKQEFEEQVKEIIQS